MRAAKPEVLHTASAVAFDDRRIGAKVSLLDESSTFILPVARAVGPSLHTLAAVDGSSIALLLPGDRSSRLSRLHWVMATSLLKTLAGKHDSTVSKMSRKYAATIQTPHGPRKCLQATVQRGARKPLVATFGGIPLRRQRTAILTDREPVQTNVSRSELVRRLLAGRCEICGDTDTMQVHQIRKLADLEKPGPERPEWMDLMARRRRKTLVVCGACHADIHGRPIALAA